MVQQLDDRFDYTARFCLIPTGVVSSEGREQVSQMVGSLEFVCIHNGVLALCAFALGKPFKVTPTGADLTKDTLVSTFGENRNRASVRIHPVIVLSLKLRTRRDDECNP